MNVTAVVLAGGVGTRLYPASSRERPKQFLSFDGGPSLLERTVERAREVADDVCVLTRPVYAERVREHVPDASVLVEPAGRDTGPALVYAAHERRDSGVLLCLPSDHFVGDGFGAIARQACRVAAETHSLVTLGVEPSRPATGYGYIEPGERHDGPGADEPDAAVGYHDVAGFYEKPDEADAERFVAEGFLWNAGVFAWRPEALLDAARATPLGSLVQALDEAHDADDRERAFADIEPVSIDYGILERASNLAVVPADVAWDDLGSWDALRRVFGDRADADGNLVLGRDDAIAIDAKDCVIATDDDTHVSVVGVSGLTVAAYDGRVLVVSTEDAQRVREVVRRLDADED